jgi:integrase
MVPKYPFNGKSQTLGQWSRELRIPYSTLRSRLVKLGQSVAEAFSKPPDTRFQPVPKALVVAPVPSPPSMHRRPDGRAAARWMDGPRRRIRYFGPWGSAEAATAYNRFCAEWYANRGTTIPAEGEAVSVAELALRYLDWATATYVKNGKPTSEVHVVRNALRRLNKIYGDTAAAEFGPQQLRTLQAAMEAEVLALKTISSYRNVVERCFKWAVSRSLVPVSIVAALETVEHLVPGRTTAPLPGVIQAAPLASVQAMLPYLHPDAKRCQVLRDLVEVMLLCGCRPQDATGLRPSWLDTAETPWLYRPEEHKTQHLGKPRVIAFGPKARAILDPYLKRGPVDVPVFRFDGGKGKAPVLLTTKMLRDFMDAACKRAGVEGIRPNQLRHTAATRTHQIYESDAAVAALLGNSEEVARRVYVDSPGLRVLKRIAEEVG